MKKQMLRLLTAFLLLSILPCRAYAAKMLVPVGRIIGLELRNNTVSVAAFEDASRAEAAGLAAGDQILRIDNTTITCADDIRNALAHSHGSVEITVRRDGALATYRIEPSITPDGPKLGIYLRQGITGIGTVTYYDPETGDFGALGHGVNDPSGGLLALSTGSAYPASVVSVRRGCSGEPGQLMGALSSRTPLGALARNTLQGVFGKAAESFGAQALPVGTADTVKPGEATILSTVSGETVQEYDVEILKVYPASRTNGRNMLLRVTDPTLLEATGGIVQGMGVSYNRDNTGNPNSLRGFQVTDP